PVRGAVEVNGGHVYVVSGSEVFKVSPGFTTEKAGSIGTSKGPIGLAYNGEQVIIVDGDAGYIVSVEDNEVEKIEDVDFHSGVTCSEYLDRYFVMGGDGSRSFYISDVANGMG